MEEDQTILEQNQMLHCRQFYEASLECKWRYNFYREKKKIFFFYIMNDTVYIISF